MKMSNTKKFIVQYWKTLLFFTILGLIGGFFSGIYLLDGYPESIRQQIINELNTEDLKGLSLNTLMGMITAIQSAGYGFVLGAVGIWFGKKVGLFKNEISITKKPLLSSLVVSVFGGIAMILPDILFFGRFSEAIINSYAEKPTAAYIFASVTYGAVIEEVMLRLFAMSFIAFILNRLFKRDNASPSAKILIASNLIAAFIFAALHLPATFILIDSSPLIITRCFLLNGGLGLLFGWLYRKYGLRYAMIAHGGCHIISKLIWILFI